MESITCVVLESRDETADGGVLNAVDAAELVVLRTGEVVKDRLGLFMKTNVDVEAPAGVDSESKKGAVGGLPRTPCSPD